MRLNLLLCFLIFANILRNVYCARILALFFEPEYRYQLFYREIWEGLASKGHHVTVYSPFREKSEFLLQNGRNNIKFAKYDNIPNIRSRYTEDFFKRSSENKDLELSEERFNIILHLEKGNFDLAIIDPSDVFLFGVANLFNIPVIAIETLPMNDYIINYFKKIPLPEKNLISMWARSRNINKKLQEIDKKFQSTYFGIRGTITKTMLDKTIFFVRSQSIFEEKRLAFNVFSYSNIPEYKGEPLPSEIQYFMDISDKQRLVYFSLGMDRIIRYMSEDVKKAVNGTFRVMKNTRFLGLWENLNGLPNVDLAEIWFPQREILRHPNLKVFITQGDIQSIEEAIWAAVPLVIIPFTKAQLKNAKEMSKDSGIPFNKETLVNAKNTSEGNPTAIYVLPDCITTTALDSAIRIASSEKYKMNALKLRSFYLEKKIQGIDFIIQRCEDMLKYNGTDYLHTYLDIFWVERLLNKYIFASSIIIILLFTVIHFLLYLFNCKYSTSYTETWL